MPNEIRLNELEFRVRELEKELELLRAERDEFILFIKQHRERFEGQ